MDVISVFISMAKPRTFSYNDYTKMIFVESNHLITNTIRNGSSQTSFHIEFSINHTFHFLF